jgi:hypothetical protein
MITITKDKIYQSPFSLKKMKANAESIKEIEVREVIFHMGEDIELGEDVTFERLFDIVIFHKEFFNILFNAEMGGLKIEDFIPDYEGVFNSESPYQEYVLRVFWATAIHEYEDHTEFYDSPVLEAFGKIDNRVDKENYSISIMFSPLCQIKDKLFTLDNSFEIQIEEDVEGDEDMIFSSDYRPFTTHNLFGCILSEISQLGTPKERDETRQEAEKNRKNIEDMIGEEDFYERISSDNLKQGIKEMIENEYPEDDHLTFWDTIYPSDKPTGKSSREIMDDAIIALSEGSSLTLEEQLDEAIEDDNFEMAAKIKKLIEKRDSKNKSE